MFIERTLGPDGELLPFSSFSRKSLADHVKPFEWAFKMWETSTYRLLSANTMCSTGCSTDDLTTPCKQVAHIGVNELVLRHAKLALSHDAFKIVVGTWEYRYCRLYNTESQHHAQSLEI